MTIFAWQVFSRGELTIRKYALLDKFRKFLEQLSTLYIIKTTLILIFAQVEDISYSQFEILPAAFIIIDQHEITLLSFSATVSQLASKEYLSSPQSASFFATQMHHFFWNINLVL